MLLNPLKDDGHKALAPSPWVQRWSDFVPAGARVLDVACGSGRHVRWFASRGAIVTGVDRDASVLASLQTLGRMVCADLETQAWPFEGETFDAVIVTNYLWRPLLSTLAASVATNGILVYETFGCGQARYGRPSNPEFLLQPLELIEATRSLHVMAYEDGVLDEPARHVQRIAARRGLPGLTPR